MILPSVDTPHGTVVLVEPLTQITFMTLYAGRYPSGTVIKGVEDVLALENT